MSAAATVVAAGAPRRDLLDQDAVLGSASAVFLSHAKGDWKSAATPLGTNSVGEAGAVDVEPLAVVGRDVAVVLVLVEPDHRSLHRSFLHTDRFRRGAGHTQGITVLLRH